MADVFFFGMLFLISLLFIANGFLMLCSPSMHARFLNWWMQADSWSTSDDAAPSRQWRGTRVEKRIVGLILLAMGLYVARVPIRFVMRQEWTATVWERAHFGDRSGGVAFPTATAVAMIATGIWFTLRPDDLIEWSKAKMPTPREISETVLKKWRFGFRLMGILLVLTGLLTLFVTWR